MTDKIKREENGTIKGVSTMGDFVKSEPLTAEQKEIFKRKKELEKKYER